MFFASTIYYMQVLVPVRYIPRNLSNKDKVKVKKELRKSRELYPKGIYHTRAPVASFQSKPSRYVTLAKKKYGLEKIAPSRKMAVATGCSTKVLRKIINKGEGAYYSSGSRPNQTAQSWGIARLASAVVGGKAAVIDYGILVAGCKPGSPALAAARRAKLTRIPKTKL